MKNNFWQTLSKPIIGLSPMDGITDAAYRYIVDKYGEPGVLFTEFVTVEGLAAGATRLMPILAKHNSKTPIVAQLVGSTPDAFYQSTIIAAALGFSGIDINMGCPDKKVMQNKAGAALISNPILTAQIIESVKRACVDWSNGIALIDAGLHQNIIDWFAKNKSSTRIENNRKKLPISVKTRINPTRETTENWIKFLTQCNLDALILHGRTVSQRYTGKADWNEIGHAASLNRESKMVFIGNGDIRSIQEAREKTEKYNVDGVLIGRAALGNPWIFKGITPDSNERFKVMLEHCQKFNELTPELHFLNLRKHLAWYCKTIPNASCLRKKLMLVENIQGIKKILANSIFLD